MPTERDGLPRSVLDNLLEGCQVIDPEYRYLYVNEAAARHARSARESLVGREMSEVYPGIEDTDMYLTLRRCMAERTVARMENAFTFPDGSSGWFELHFEPVPEGVAILSVEITARKTAELALRRSVRALTTLSRSNQALVRAVDEDVFVRDVAHMFVEAGGYPMAGVGLVNEESATGVTWVATATFDEGLSDGDLAPLLESEGVTNLVERALTAESAIVVRWDPAEPHTGVWGAAALEHGFGSCLVLPVSQNEERIGVILAYAVERDAFDHDETELLGEVALDLGYGIRALRYRKAMRAIYDDLPHPTLIWKRRGGVLILLDANEAARALSRGEVSDRIGQPSTDFGSAIPHLEEDLALCLREHEPIRREEECALFGLEDRRRLALTYSYVPPDMVLLHAEDVTERRRTEEQLVASQRLDAVGRLAGGVAHDFNNLLSVILTSAAFALERLPESDPIREDITQIHDAGQSAASLTRQLLAFSRRQVLEPQITDLNRVLVGMETMIRRVFREDIDIEVHQAANLGSVMADAAQLERVVMNLALNARDAMPEGGKLTIETADVDLDEEYADRHIAVQAGPYVCLSVGDTGAGMGEETLDRVFEPFFTTKTEGRGTGLGLSSVYGIVKQSGGNIWLYSEPGEGTTVKIYLPRVEAAPARERRAEAAAVATGNETILVVEDEDGVRRAAERILVRVGYRVLTAASGAAALLLGEERGGEIDLLLTDVVMPEMRGQELAERLRETVPGLKVLFMSGYAEGAVGHRGALDEGSHFIGKPFSVDGLQRKVREVLDGE